MVSAKKITPQRIVKAAIDSNKYELEVINGSQRVRAIPGQAKINGQAKQAAPRVQGKSIRFKDDPDDLSA